MILSVLVAQTAFAEEAKTDSSDISLMEAKVYLTSGETEKARQLAEQVLAGGTNNDEAREVLSQVIDREIAQEKETAPRSEFKEELSVRDKQLEADRWMERAKSFAAMHQYEQAILSAEKVFLFSPQNLQASRLIDQIQHQALEEGTKGANSLNQEAKEEAKERIKRYQAQAAQWIKEKRYGGARLALDKILLLDPVNDEAMQQKQTIRKLLENEKGKTL